MDWNVVVSIYQDGYHRALRALAQLGQVQPSPYYNVLVMRVDNLLKLLSTVEQVTEKDPALYDAIARIAPAMREFEFHSAEEFKELTKAVVLGWTPQLIGRSFHVRLHLRGARHGLHATDMERFLDDEVVAATAETGAPAKISFAAPDAVIVIDTVDDRGGASIWTRQELAEHRLLRPD